MINLLEIKDQYDPKFHPLPIRWMNSKALYNLKLGQNESPMKHTTTPNYPNESVVVKVQCDAKGIRYCEIRFVGIGKNTWNRGDTRLRLYKGHTWDTKTQTAIHSPVIDKIQFCNEFSIEKFAEFAPYINYIISQLNTL